MQAIRLPIFSLINHGMNTAQQLADTALALKEKIDIRANQFIEEQIPKQLIPIAKKTYQALPETLFLNCAWFEIAATPALILWSGRCTVLSFPALKAMMNCNLTPSEMFDAFIKWVKSETLNEKEQILIDGLQETRGKFKEHLYDSFRVAFTVCSAAGAALYGIKGFLFGNNHDRLLGILFGILHNLLISEQIAATHNTVEGTGGGG